MGGWNIRTMKQMGKPYLLVRELRTPDINACGLCEVIWTGEEHFTHETLRSYATVEQTGNKMLHSS